jgi:hypothetical protein
MYTYKMHVCKMCTYKMHACKMRTCKMHVHEMHVYEMHVYEKCRGWRNVAAGEIHVVARDV